MIEWVNDDLVLTAKLASGGMAEVYRGIQFGAAGFRRQVAVKRVLPHLADETSFCEQFLYEARLSARLQHPNIVSVFLVIEHGETPIVVMEYVPGLTISDIMRLSRERHCPISPAWALFVAMSICHGLAFAHDLKDEQGNPLNVVHRDVSPQNLMVTFDGSVKILDFGIARAADRVTKTRTGTLKGKLGYMAPEYIEQGMIDSRSDLFAVGVLLYELLSGQQLFDGPTMGEYLAQIREYHAPKISSIMPGIPPVVDQIVQKALSRNPDTRFQTAEEMARQLKSALLQIAPRFSQPECAAVVHDLCDAEQVASAVDGEIEQVRAQKLARKRAFRRVSMALRDLFSLSRPLVTRGAPVKIALAIFLVVLNINYMVERYLKRPVVEAPPPARAEAIAWWEAGPAGPEPRPLQLWHSMVGGKRAEQRDPVRAPLLRASEAGGEPVLAFDGINDALEAPDLLPALRDATGLSVVFAGRSLAQKIAMVFSIQQEDRSLGVFRLGLEPSGRAYFKTRASPDSPSIFTNPHDLSRFFIVTATADRSRTKLFFNGVLEAEEELQEDIQFPKSAVVSIGRNFIRGQEDQFFSGELLYLGVLPRALPEKSRQELEQYLRGRFSGARLE